MTRVGADVNIFGSMKVTPHSSIKRYRTAAQEAFEIGELTAVVDTLDLVRVVIYERSRPLRPHRAECAEHRSDNIRPARCYFCTAESAAKSCRVSKQYMPEFISLICLSSSLASFCSTIRSKSAVLRRERRVRNPSRIFKFHRQNRAGGSAALMAMMMLDSAASVSGRIIGTSPESTRSVESLFRKYRVLSLPRRPFRAVLPASQRRPFAPLTHSKTAVLTSRPDGR